MASCFCVGPPGNCPCVRRDQLLQPFDAALLQREMIEETRRQFAEAFYRSNDFKQMIKEILDGQHSATGDKQ